MGVFFQLFQLGVSQWIIELLLNIEFVSFDLKQTVWPTDSILNYLITTILLASSQTFTSTALRTIDKLIDHQLMKPAKKLTLNLSVLIWNKQLPIAVNPTPRSCFVFFAVPPCLNTQVRRLSHRHRHTLDQPPNEFPTSLFQPRNIPNKKCWKSNRIFFF